MCVCVCVWECVLCGCVYMIALTAPLAYPRLSVISLVYKVSFLHAIQMLAFPAFSLFSNATKMRPLLRRWLALSCLTAILSSSGSIHLLWLPNKQQALQSNPRHLFLPSHKLDLLLSDLSAFSPLHTISLLSLLLSESKAGYPEGTRLSILCIIFNRKDMVWHVAMQSGEFCIILALRMFSTGS